MNLVIRTKYLTYTPFTPNNAE